MSNTIELSKKRDFGELISDSFVFVRENFVPLVKCFFIFCGFFLVATVVFGWITEAKVIKATTDLSSFNSDNFDNSTNPFAVFAQLFGVEYFLLILVSLLGYVTIFLTVISYMAVYKAKGNKPATPAEVWGYFKYYFLKITGSTVIVFILLVLGCVCCLIPGIWLYPILTLIFPIIIVENRSFGDAFNQSFRLIKENWWTTFGALFVMGIIVAILRAIITMPIGAVDVISLFLSRGKNMHLSPTLMLISLVAGEIAHIFYILSFVTLTLCYFSLTEQKDAVGLMERIQQLGGNNDADKTDKPAEEY
jgi:hypothetical protein